MGRRANQILTQRQVDAAEATGKQYVLGDAKVTGLRLWVGVKGEKRWQIRRTDGTRKILPFEKHTLDEARIAARSWEPDPPPRTGPRIKTVKAMIKEYAETKGEPWCKRTNRIHQLNVFLRTELNRPILIHHITKEWIEERQEELLHTTHAKAGRTYAGSSVMTYRKAVAIFFNWMVDKEFIAKSPFRRLRRIPIDKKTYVLEEENIQRLKDFMATYDRNHAVACLIMLYLCAGLRKDEAKKLLRSDFNWSKNRLTIRAATTKSRRSRWFTISKELRAFLDQRLPHLPETLPFQTVSLEHEWNWIRRHVNLDGEHITIHGLRHSWATSALRRGGNIKSISDQLGHADIATTMIYLHRLGYDSDALADLMDRPWKG